MSKGYMFLAFGEKYCVEAINLSKTIRNTGDELPISIVCTTSDVKLLEQSNLFDNIIIHTFDNELYQKDCNTNFEKFCLIPRLLFNTFLVYDETIIVDTDMLCQYNPSHVWDTVSSIDQAVVMTGQNISPDWHFGFNHEVSKNLGKNVPESHGGFFYIKKHHKDIDTFFKTAIDVYKNYDKYKLKRMFRGGRVDEPIFAIVNALLDYKVMEFGEEAIITFNYDNTMELPSKYQTFGRFKDSNPTELKNYIPFVHMFVNDNLQVRNEYPKLLNKLLNEEADRDNSTQ